MLSPRSVEAGFAGKKLTHKIGEWKSIGDNFALALKVILRDHDVAGVADDIDHLFVSRIEILVALDNARTRNAHKVAVARDFRAGNDAIDVGEIDRFVGTNEIRDQKARPGVARLGK